MTTLPRPGLAPVVNIATRQHMDSPSTSKRGGKREPLPKLTITIPNYGKYQGSLKKGQRRVWVRFERNTPNDIKLSRLSIEARYLFLSLVMICDEGALSDVTVADVGRFLGMEYRTVISCLKQLNDSGMVWVDRCFYVTPFAWGETGPDCHAEARAKQGPVKGEARASQGRSKGDTRESQVETLERSQNEAEKPDTQTVQTDSTEKTITPLPPQGEVRVVVSLISEDGRPYAVTSARISEWQAAFPTLDVEAEIRAAAVWHDTNPGNRKTYAGMSRFLSGWLLRARDKPKRQQEQLSIRNGELSSGRLHETGNGGAEVSEPVWTGPPRSIYDLKL